MSNLLTVAEVAARLRLSRQTVYGLVEQRLISHQRVGLSRRGKVLISEVALQEYLASREVAMETKEAAQVRPPRRQYKNFTV